MPVAPSKFSHEMKIRLKTVEALDMVKKVYETKKYKSVNAVANAAFEKGLPLLLDEEYSVNPKRIADQVAEQVLNQLQPLSKSLSFNIKKIAILQTVQESMVSSLIQEFEFFLKMKGIEFDHAMLEEFRVTLPDRFEQDKQDLIERLFDAADVETEENTDE